MSADPSGPSAPWRTLAPCLGLLATALYSAAVAAPRTDPPAGDSLTARVVVPVQEFVEHTRKAVDAMIAEEARAAEARRGVFVLDAPTAASGGVVQGGVPGGSAEGLTWSAFGTEPSTPQRVVLLVHGLDEPGSIWDNLAPALRDAGYAVARFNYPDDQALAPSCELLGHALREMRARGVTRVDLVCHSMGGLIARDVLTCPGEYAGHASWGDGESAPAGGALPKVPCLITLGTPNRGSPWARLRAVAEIRSQIARFVDDPNHKLSDLFGFLSDGLGEAGRDLLPGSAYLAELNSRPLPAGVAITVIIGRLAPVTDANLAAIANSSMLRYLIGPTDAQRVSNEIASLSTELGDGVVPARAAELAGTTDVVYLEANHRDMVKTIKLEQSLKKLAGGTPGPPPAIPVILDRLGREQAR